MRTERDSIGEMKIPLDALYGIHAARARENFPDNTFFFEEWYNAVGTVKLACYRTYKKFKAAAQSTKNSSGFAWIDDYIVEALIRSASEVSEGLHFDSFIVPAIQGGAGTSINLNVNEIIANRSLELINKTKGSYEIIDPIEHANIFQSTNDVIPTSLRVAVLRLLNVLENAINATRQSIEKHEAENRSNLRIGYTQMQEAVPSSFGRLFSTYSDAMSRDWWRVSKCFERIKTVNLGGGAIGTGIAIPRFFIMEVITELQQQTNLPVARAENLQDATANLDTFVEVHAIMKAHAVNLEKMVSDLRMLSADAGTGDIALPKRQTGSSIMPGKINPVIPEFIVSVAHKVYANDQIITSLSALGCLDLNAYLPTIGHALLDSLKLLIAANKSLANFVLKELGVNSAVALAKLYHSPSITTALVPYIGYNQSAILANRMKVTGMDIFEANQEYNLIDHAKLIEIVSPEKLLQLGYSLNDLLND
jgi:aspartate ammonia-lyase